MLRQSFLDLEHDDQQQYSGDKSAYLEADFNTVQFTPTFSLDFSKTDSRQLFPRYSQNFTRFLPQDPFSQSQ
jgi:hypothetical protein